MGFSFLGQGKEAGRSRVWGRGMEGQVGNRRVFYQEVSCSQEGLSANSRGWSEQADPAAEWHSAVTHQWAQQLY